MNKSNSTTSGALFAVDLLIWGCIPIVATLLDIWWKGQPFSPVAALAAQTSQPLLWIIDCIPILFVLWRPSPKANKPTASSRPTVSTEQQITERTAKLTKQIAELKSQVVYLRQEREELRGSEDLYRNLVEHANDSMFALSMDGTITTINPGFTTLLGKHRDDLIGRHCSTVLPSASLTLVEEQIQRSQRGERTPTTVELSFFHQNGKSIEVEARFLFSVDTQGNATGIQGICRAKRVPELSIPIVQQKSAPDSLTSSEPAATLQASFPNSTLGETPASAFPAPHVSTPTPPPFSLTPSFYEDTEDQSSFSPRLSSPSVPVSAPASMASVALAARMTPSPVPPSPTAIPVEQALDLEAALSRVDGDRELLVEMADLFLDEYPRLLSTLRDALAQDNAPTAAYAAHTLKGSVANFSAMPSVTAAQKIERLARQGDLTHAHAAFADLEAKLTQLKPVLLNLKMEIAA